MSALDKLDEKRAIIKLADLVNEEVEKAIEHDLFALNNQNLQPVTNNVFRYLESLKTRKAIDDFSVETRPARWEDYYPTMIERLLAIEALEYRNYPSRVEDVTLPEYLQGYPYQRETNYLLKSKLPSDHDDYWEEWLFDEIDLPHNREDLTITEYKYWVLKDPTYATISNISFTALKPVNKLNILIKR